ncbi:hypothetical protein Tco_1471493, partial [Tanacetum coccineum]
MSSQTPLLQSEIIKAPGLNMYHRNNSIVELADHNIWSAINEFCHAPSFRRVKLRHNVHEAEYLKESMRNGLEIGLSVGGKLFRLSMLRIR